MTIDFTTADRLSLAELLDAWNRGFAGYYVDNTLTEDRLAAHIRRNGIELPLSPVLLADGRPAAFSLAAVRQDDGGPKRAWIGGFGVAPEHRRQGLAGRLLQAQNELLDAAGVAETWLEVIDVNPARRVYSAGGFREDRTLQSFEGVPQLPSTDGGARIERPEPSRLAEVRARIPGLPRPTWRRDPARLPLVLPDIPTAELLAVQDGGSAAYALVVAGPERVSLLDGAASDRSAGLRLIAAIAAAYPGQPLRIVDEPVESPLAEALAAAGLGNFLTQFEMVRNR